MSDTDLVRIRTRYSGIEDQIGEIIKIDSGNWEKVKTKYNLTCIVIKKILKKTNEAEDSDGKKKSAIETFYKMFTDVESDLGKYTQNNWYIFSVFKTSNIKKAEQMTSKESDEEFIKKLVEFELFEGYDDIKEKIINVFIEKYHKWKNEDFPNNLKNILPSTQNNEQLDKLKREYEEEKKTIEKNMFEQICNEIEKNIKMAGESSAVNYYETSLKVDNNHQIQQNETYIPSPILLSNMNQYGISFRIPEAYDFKKISQFDKDKFLLMLYNKDKKRIEIFFNTARQLAQNFKSHSTINPFKILYTDENFIIAVNEPKGLFAIYNTEEVKLDVFSFDDNRSRLYGCCANIQLLQWYSGNIPNIKYFLFIKDTKELCFVENCGRTRIFNLVNLQFRVADCKFPSNLVNVLSSPDSSCVMAFTKEILGDKPDGADSIISSDYNNDIKEINRVYVYFSENFGGAVNKIINLPLNFKFLEFLQISFKITLQKAKFCFQKCMQNHSLALQRTESNDLINAYKLMFEKYPIDSCIDPEQSRPLSLKVVLDVDKNNIKKYEKFKKYVTKIFDNLKHSTKKPANILKGFFISVITFQELDIVNVKFQKKFSSEYQLGDMGEQSCGKSFMLNHLVGTTFDGSAMRCTEGVWMSLVNTKECIYVALDFEGLRSLERTPQEDMFLTLFNTVVSNLILYKNQYTINRDASKMFQKFQDGVKLFESDPNIFQARLCIIIKDVPETDKNGITKEFQLKLDKISCRGGDNFITKMYGGGLNIIAWPVFHDVAWFKKLSNIKNKLDKQETKYENAKTFLQNTKLIMAKLKICDWSSLNENLIHIRVATLKRLLPIAVSYGIEQKDPIIEPLVNHDSKEPIDGPIDFLNDEKPIKLFPDDDDHVDEFFIQLSEYLRNHFEKTTQPRKESSDDNEWFSNFDRFLKDIIKRQTLRVQNWYMQNTVKFPQDNSDIIDGKYALGQKIGELARLWTLCGLTCHQCGLKCVKNCGYKENHDHKDKENHDYKENHDHTENHDCLTDHKCHFPCHFTEAHNDSPTPECRHKAGHKGKHACAKMIHLCGKACFLIDKFNCQKVCSKEIGHDDGEHLCQSKRNHYCGEDCSLSIHNTKGDYRCPNKCIISYEEEHDFHCCESTICPIQCPIPDCKERCQKEGVFHYCDKKCQFCKYYCTLPYGHPQQIHDTKHGNMTQTEFTGEDDEFVYAGYNLRVGDQGTFVLCNFPKDFISHKLFWERTGFKDPYTVQEQQKFAKCDHECPDEKHHKSGSTSFCELQLFHAPISKPPNDYGYISTDGHYFNCENPNNAFHIIFVLDYSSSMSGQDIKPMQDFLIYNDLTKKHNNRIGAVYQAVYLFMNARRNSAKITMPDSISLILFNHEPIVPFEYRDLTNLKDLLNSMLQYKANGFTNFDNAIQKAGILIKTHFDPMKVNVIIFLSDGECKTPTNQLNAICKQNKEKGSPLYLYTVLFGSDRHSDSLEKMAKIAQSYHPQNSSPNALRCQFTSTADAGKLVNHFNYVEDSLRKHKPALLKKV
ncbi:hypothetical protein RhiirB3_528171 [Rhizophagus irregularis]|nr:hypothetical protein RhiirB3_528171 [Rhizophagus irregularis]